MISDGTFFNAKTFNQNVNSENIRILNRSVWAEKLQDGDKLPVGGSMFSDNPLLDGSTLKIELDFDSLKGDLVNFTHETISNLYQKNKLAMDSWLKESNSTIDPFLYFALY